MSEQVYEIDALRKSVMEALRKEDRWMTTGELGLAIGAPYWAVDAALEHAYLAKEAEFVAGAGWRALNASASRAAVSVDDDGQGVLA